MAYFVNIFAFIIKGAINSIKNFQKGAINSIKNILNGAIN